MFERFLRRVGKLHLPSARVRLVRGDNATTFLRALVDTGASVTLLDFSLHEALGFSAAEVREGRSVLLGGINGKDFYGYEARIDISFHNNGTPALTLKDAVVYFAEGGLPQNWDVLIGQHDALERLKLVQCNFGDEPFFVLEPPKEFASSGSG